MASVADRTKRRTASVRRSLKASAYGRPRLSVYRSGMNIYAQVIDDAKGGTIAAASSLEKDIFDRGGYRFHGRVKALADAAREGGLSF
jgi:large subunit ribosomal protein L18